MKKVATLPDIQPSSDARCSWREEHTESKADSMSSVKAEWKQEILFKCSAHKITAAWNSSACAELLTPLP